MSVYCAGLKAMMNIESAVKGNRTMIGTLIFREEYLLTNK